MSRHGSNKYGSIANITYANTAPKTPEVGMGVTQLVGSDRYPYTVVEIITPRKIVVQRDEYKYVGEPMPTESQKYEYTPNPEAGKRIITLRKDGRWVEQGVTGGPAWYVGKREAYYDPSR